MPIHMRLPKRGFNKPNRKKWAELSIANLERAIQRGQLDLKKPVDAEALVKSGLLRRSRDGVRLIGTGELSKAVNLVVSGATPGAIKIVEGAKGSVEVTEAKPVRVKKDAEAPKAKKPAAKKEPAKKADAPVAKAAPAEKTPAKKTPAKKTAAKSDGYDKHIPYFENIKEKYDAKADEAVVMTITKYLGASLNDRDSKYVACGDETERNTVRDAFLKKKLGLKDEKDVLDAKVIAVCDEMKAAKQRMKDRVTFYYLLAKNEGKLGDI